MSPTDARYGFFGDQTLFQLGEFVGASGLKLPWKIECDVLNHLDWEWAARYVDERIKFGEVEGVPEGGLEFAGALQKYLTKSAGLLIVDDVLTTGGSMIEHRDDRGAKGYVLFARGLLPEWVSAIWSLSPILEKRPEERRRVSR